MKISIQSFGGNKDNYYNFKHAVQEARIQVRYANLYTFDGRTSKDLDNLINIAKDNLEKIEFED